MFSWYKYLIVNLVFSHLGFWSGNLFLIASFPDLCLPFLSIPLENSVFKKCVSIIYGHVWIAHSMVYVLVLQRRLSVIERSDA